MLRRECDGQAMIELMVAVLLLLLVITGILHINKMVWSSLFLHSVIRGTAGEKAMSPFCQPCGFSAIFSSSRQAASV